MKKNPSAKERRYIVTALVLAIIGTVVNIYFLYITLMNKGNIDYKLEDMEGIVLYGVPTFLVITSVIVPMCRDKRKTGILVELKKMCSFEGDTLDKICRIKKHIEKCSCASLKTCSLDEKMLVLKTELTTSLEGTEGEYLTSILETCFLGLMSVYVADGTYEKISMIISYAIVWLVFLFRAESKKEEREKNLLILSVIESMENMSDKSSKEHKK